MIVIEIAGWAGMILLLLTFFLASNKWLCDKTYPYHLLNLVGALGVMANAFYKGVMAVGFVELAWSAIALVGIYNAYNQMRSSS